MITSMISVASAACRLRATSYTTLAARHLSTLTRPHVRRSNPLLKQALNINRQSVAAYHYDKDIYGYRTPRTIELPAYTPEEVANRNANANLLRLVKAFRTHGHRQANLDPLGLTPTENIVELDPAFYGLPEKGKTFPLAGILHLGETSSNPAVSQPQSQKEATIEEILAHLRRTYSGRIAFEIEHIPSSSERRWLANYIEAYEGKTLNPKEKLHLFEELARSEVFDHFMGKRFPQVKRYGLEGAESMVVALDTLFKKSSHAGVRDVILCMPHRGRLNLLTDILRFNAAALFHKVKGNAEFPDNVPGIGDVLSHLANSVDLDYGGKKPLHVSMLHNPSHLEAVNPVAMGKARARQMYLYEEGTETDCYLGDRVMCVQLHGDAAFTGQGVVTETLGLSNLPHFTSGGSVHVIVNNQIGYTTPAMNARSTVYTSDVAKMINAPVIHVNADFPEDVANAISIAFEYRNTFRKDVILDLIAYRRWGHNELDEPAFTQPLMYKNIRTRKSVPKMYEESLIADKIITQAQADDFRTAYFNELDKKLQESYDYKPELDALKGKWSKMILPTTAVTKPETGVEIDTLKDVGRKSVQAPAGVTVHPRLAKYHIEQRLSKIESGTKLDWATAEALAFGSLLLDGYNVRISGQDVGRGTFSQRHVMLVDQETERTIIPLNRLHKPDASGAAPLAQTKKQGMLEIANSSLSEFAVMGFELGVSWETPNRLCIWEAQFGDFFNGAQIVIDTYLSSGEAKWFRQTGLVLLLPHGYDGAGPEHSSARLERFLQLCDQKFDVLNEKNPDNPNMHVVNPTTPAQYFHLLRRQMVRPFRKPLVVIGPKILLRHPQAVSDLAEMGPKTHFHPVLPDPTISAAQTKDVRRVIFVCGKLYYDLVKARQDKKLDGQVAIVRMEELAPFPTAEVVEELAKFGHVREFFWVQEEPQNQGAYTYVEPRLSQLLPNKEASATTSAPPRGYLHYVGRAPCAAPAVGVSSRHKAEHATLLKQAFEGL